MAVKGKHWQKCKVRQCRKYAVNEEGFCVQHEIPAGVGQKYPTVLEALLAAVSAKYADDGDRTKAGVVLACLQHDPPLYYASVARYPYGPRDKQIVCATSKSEPHRTVEQTIDALARAWYALNRPQPVEDTLNALGEVLR